MTWSQALRNFKYSKQKKTSSCEVIKDKHETGQLSPILNHAQQSLQPFKESLPQKGVPSQILLIEEEIGKIFQ